MFFSLIERYAFILLCLSRNMTLKTGGTRDTLPQSAVTRSNRIILQTKKILDSPVTAQKLTNHSHLSACSWYVANGHMELHHGRYYIIGVHTIVSRLLEKNVQFTDAFIICIILCMIRQQLLGLTALLLPIHGFAVLYFCFMTG